MSRLEPDDLYYVEHDLPELGEPVLVQALDGFVDAGGAKRLAREHLLAQESTLIASFDVDALLDYRARRPVMVFDEDHWSEYADPSLEIRLTHDVGGTPFLVLTGPEPDVYWDTFISAVRTLVVDLGVRLTVGLNAIPMAVPHTRPLGIIAHGTRKELVAPHERWVGTVQVPSSAGHLLEYRLGQANRDAAGLAVAVPHYLADAAYPLAAVRLLDALAGLSGLTLDTADLAEQGAAMRAEVDKQVGSADEVQAIVTALEQQYDSSIAGASKLMADMGGALPTGDELGDEFQRYLADQGEA